MWDWDSYAADLESTMRLAQERYGKINMSRYDDLVLSHNPVLFHNWSTDNYASMPNGDRAVAFNGIDDFVAVPSRPEYSIPHTGTLTVEAWLCPATRTFPNSEGAGYVHWLGKGKVAGTVLAMEYGLRWYSATATERPGRISAYCWNPEGGLGAGSYSQVDGDPVPEKWTHIVATFVAGGNVTLWRDGVWSDSDPLIQYNIVPVAGNEPFAYGTRDGRSFFQGAIGKVALYGRELTDSEIAEHYNAMMEPEIA